ncbi:GNAT family N-acetyltransferase [Streptomyces resistomycificus]|uniref:Protein tyrosine phosphatase n=1 Tax=Streptomyces resistomycificus TaxID=67356 RepID=A0A0L8KRP4_9ACTN|nr:GNAT family N-acetyltransferase [Streptomyces resistomycificus]KOG28550.1 protein tyrosine phosphatase [Streptomyces resistomycificus]KUN91165.1 protein tyrosine phosphatase [Streptomyces resistomycificus]
MDRHLPFSALHNFRDLGGYRTPDGLRVRPGRLYRADSLGRLSPGTPDWDRFLSLGIRTVIDLRHPWEADAGGRVPSHPSFTYHNLSIEHRPYNQAALTADVDPGPYLAERYMEVAEDGTKEIRGALELIARSAESETPLVFHCASGKDRTGQLAALVLSLLGVPEQTIVEDYSLTELAAPALLADWIARNDGHPPAWPAFGRAPASGMRLFLAALTARHGSVEAYVSEALGLSPAPLTETLRAHLLEQPPTVHPPLTYRKAVPDEAALLVRLRDTAALWQLARGITQWLPGEKDETHFRARMTDGEVWLAHAGDHLSGAWELWWDDPAAWGPRPPDAGYIHRLMTTPHTAPPGTGRHLLREAESRIRATGRPYARLDCLSTNPRLRTYYESAGYQVVGEQPAKNTGSGSPYAVTLLEKRLV